MPQEGPQEAAGRTLEGPGRPRPRTPEDTPGRPWEAQGRSEECPAVPQEGVRKASGMVRRSGPEISPG